ncbi:MAG: DUF922 domain-containing protein [Ruegeria sp.]|uniref:DUF922 domain-containing protein n=1 Tax=Ruegeria sp. TaxID=1879320 RepID=UPI00349EFCA7
MPTIVKKFSTKTYPVKGKNLVEIWNYLVKNGPKVRGTRRAGRTGYKITVGSPKLTGTVTENPKTKKFEAVAEITTVSVQAYAQSELPKLDAKSKSLLSNKAKKEWLRFLAHLGAHEEGHRICTENVAKKIGREVEALEVKVAANTDKDAQAQSIKELQKAFNSGYSPKKVKSRLEAEQANYDRTATGKRAQKVKLDVTIK